MRREGRDEKLLNGLKLLRSCLGTIFADVLSQPLQILGNHLESLATAAAAAMTDRSTVGDFMGNFHCRPTANGRSRSLVVTGSLAVTSVMDGEVDWRASERASEATATSARVRSGGSRRWPLFSSSSASLVKRQRQRGRGHQNDTFIRGIGSSSSGDESTSSGGLGGVGGAGGGGGAGSLSLPGLPLHRCRGWWAARPMFSRRRGLKTAGRRARSDLQSKKRMMASPTSTESVEMMNSPARRRSSSLRRADLRLSGVK